MNQEAVATSPEPVGTTPSRQSRRVARVASYAFWSAFGTVLPLFFDRIIVQPILARELGAELFGGLIWVLVVVNLIGYVGAAGFSTLLMRDYASYSPDQARLAYRCSLLLSTVISCILLGISAVISYFLADGVVRVNAWPLYVPLVIVGLLRADTYILQTNLRIRRAFKVLFLMQLLEGIVLCANLIAAPTKNLWWVGLVYVASVLATVPFAAWNIEDIDLRASWWDRKTAKMLMGGWSAGAMISLINNSQIYLSRLVVGPIAGSTQVAVLFPGIAIGNLFMMPVTILAQLVLSLLGGVNKFVLTGRKATLYFLAVVAFSSLLSLASWLLGKYAVSYLYPEFAAETLAFYSWIAIANGFSSVMIMERAVMLKYAPLWITTWLSGGVLVIQMIGLFVLVPRTQAAGAAQAACISSIVSAVLFTIFYFRMAMQQNRDPAKK